jgi:small conductance mechanosensitive channel
MKASLLLILLLETSSGIEFPSSHIPSAEKKFDASQTFEELKDHLEESIVHYSAIMGKIFPFLSKLFISPRKAKQIYKNISIVQHPGDWIFILFLGWGTMPIIRFPYEKGIMGSKRKKEFRQSYTYLFADQLSQAGKIAALVYSIDCIIIALTTMGFHGLDTITPIIVKSIYTTWAFRRISACKRHIIYNAFGVSSDQDASNVDRKAALSRARIVNRLIETFIIAGLLLSIVDLLQLKTGKVLSSLFALSGAGTLVISYGAKDLASEIVSGLALQSSDKIYEGETVEFGNGIKGTVDKIGIFETLIRDASEMVTHVPNAELTKQRITNISRNSYSRVKQQINLDYKDIDRLPHIMGEIERGIRLSCPFVVQDGSKPLRVYFYEYDDCYLKVIVDVRLKVKPYGTEYYTSRQHVLLVIGRAVKGCNANFVVLGSH